MKNVTTQKLFQTSCRSNLSGGIVDSLKIKRSQYIFRMTPSELEDIFLTLKSPFQYNANTTFKWSANGIIILTK